MVPDGLTCGSCTLGALFYSSTSAPSIACCLGVFNRTVMLGGNSTGVTLIRNHEVAGNNATPLDVVFFGRALTRRPLVTWVFQVQCRKVNEVADRLGLSRRSWASCRADKSGWQVCCDIPERAENRREAWRLLDAEICYER